jgi:hypothetical protein
MVASPAFAAGDLDTGFLQRYPPDWRLPYAVAIAAEIVGASDGSASDAVWNRLGSWRSVPEEPAVLGDLVL